MSKIINPQEWREASELVKKGGLIAFATDTVYGLACRYDNQDAQNRLIHCKGRPEEKPFPLVVGSLEQCEKICVLDERSRKIFNKWLPGAITLILPKKAEVPDHINNGKDTLAIRMIDGEGITELISDVGVPLFLTSANLSGDSVCMNAEEVNDRLGDKLDIIIDGKHRDGLASTILDCTKSELIVLRQGPITLEDIKLSLEE
ncbi:MAG: L-threonylcarbamoyladenylate synthase [Longicatena sp.]|jgi:L-threonylcarbamoyladenylate synthase|uniref:L-threonylcarbamoyladenylate synthase n=1 Tax=Anaerorhabdus sp. TaxID=1872524 RepID=UPI002FC70F85